MSVRAHRMEFLVLLAAMMLWIAPTARAQQHAGKAVDKNSHDQAQLIWRVYDIRDLNAVMPPLPPEPSNEGNKGQAPQSFLQQQHPLVADELFERLSQNLDVAYCPVSDGIYMVETQQSKHDQLMSLVEQFRALYTDRYAIRLVCSLVKPSEAPQIGQEWSAGETFVYCNQVAIRRVQMPIRVTRDRRYVADLSPVAAQNATAYMVGFNTITDGINFTLTIGAGKESQKSTPVRLTGEITECCMDGVTGPDGTGDGGHWCVQQPEIARRLVYSDLQVAFGQPTVLAVIPGFDDEHVIVVAVSVDRLSH